MKRLLITALVAVALSSCSAPLSLYYWGNGRLKMNSNTTSYEDYGYKSYIKRTPEATCALIVTYEDMVKHPGGTRQVPPPGICAEYAYLLIQPYTASIFAEHASTAQKAIFEGQTDYVAFFSNYAGELFEKEMELYPESQAFIKPLIEKIRNRGN